ncbi:PucR family transcriptional regulator [Mycolicibacterium neoaurum]|uniref:PucR family transcriptional regulator n=1 Tax=Mycolicibacterium neoaurum TaxID=1795 RepID=UPI003AB94846
MTDTASAVVSRVAQQMNVRRDGFIDALVQVTRAEIQPLDNDSRMVDLLNASITENVIAAIHYLEHGTNDPTAAEIEASAAALAYARALAQRDVALSALIRAYRIGHGRFVDEAMALLATQASADLSLPAARELVHRAAAWIDRICDQVGMAYETERDRWVSSRSGLRQHWVAELLSGAAVDIGKVEEALDYRLDRHHLAAVMWPDDTVPTRDVADLFDRTRAVLGAAAGADGPSLMVPTDEREARLWWPVIADSVDITSLAGVLADAPIWVATGDLGFGVDGFRRSLREAEQSKVVALAAGPAVSRVVCHARVAPVALMAAHQGDLRTFVQRTLGDLAVDDDRRNALRETLCEFLIRNRSYAAAADALFLHRNTIQYRVGNAMQACGASFDDPEALMHVQIALLACRWMGKTLLVSSTRH